ncbi:MAG: hypothetical protein JWN34_1986 [Bryobacterales bacterium]|jgi:hypothetical protein|nr:hypothetical protein [Bryobacterales bacterium]
MTVIVPHGKTKEAAMGIVDGSIEKLIAGIGGDSLEIANLKKAWDGPRMDFSLVAKLGFISLPISGTALVDPVDLTISLILPAMVNNFIGPDKIRRGVEDKFRVMFAS